MSTTLPIRVEKGFSIVKVVESAVMAFAGFFHNLHQAYAAARDFERLSHLSDVELARRGLTRDTLPQHICRTYLDA